MWASKAISSRLFFTQAPNPIRSEIKELLETGEAGF
jgi:hypothetical protein